MKQGQKHLHLCIHSTGRVSLSSHSYLLTLASSQCSRVAIDRTPKVWNKSVAYKRCRAKLFGLYSALYSILQLHSREHSVLTSIRYLEHSFQRLQHCKADLQCCSRGADAKYTKPIVR